MSRGIPSVSYNSVTCQEVKQMEGTDFFNTKLGKYIISSIDKLQFEHEQILHILDLRM